MTAPRTGAGGVEDWGWTWPGLACPGAGGYLTCKVVRQVASSAPVANGTLPVFPSTVTVTVPLMSRGDTFRFWIPGSLGYDNAPASPNAPRGTLVFDITLYDFTNPR